MEIKKTNYTLEEARNRVKRKKVELGEITDKQKYYETAKMLQLEMKNLVEAARYEKLLGVKLAIILEADSALGRRIAHEFEGKTVSSKSIEDIYKEMMLDIDHAETE